LRVFFLLILKEGIIIWEGYGNFLVVLCQQHDIKAAQIAKLISVPTPWIKPEIPKLKWLSNALDYFAIATLYLRVEDFLFFCQTLKWKIIF
jgi:hypothetical protein